MGSRVIVSVKLDGRCGLHVLARDWFFPWQVIFFALVHEHVHPNKGSSRWRFTTTIFSIAGRPEIPAVVSWGQDPHHKTTTARANGRMHVSTIEKIQWPSTCDCSGIQNPWPAPCSFLFLGAITQSVGNNNLGFDWEIIWDCAHGWIGNLTLGRHFHDNCTTKCELRLHKQQTFTRFSQALMCKFYSQIHPQLVGCVFHSEFVLSKILRILCPVF